MCQFKGVGVRPVRATTVTSCFSGREYSCSMAGTVAATPQTPTHCPGLNNQVVGQTLMVRTDMQLDEGFWMRWSDDWGSSFTGGRVVVPVRRF